MITIDKTSFRIDTKNTTYIFQKTKYGHLEHIYYGNLLSKEDRISSLRQKRSIQVGSSILYDKGLYMGLIPCAWNGQIMVVAITAKVQQNSKCPMAALLLILYMKVIPLLMEHLLWIPCQRLMEEMRP